MTLLSATSITRWALRGCSCRCLSQCSSSSQVRGLLGVGTGENERTAWGWHSGCCPLLVSPPLSSCVHPVSSRLVLVSTPSRPCVHPSRPCVHPVSCTPRADVPSLLPHCPAASYCVLVMLTKLLLVGEFLALPDNTGADAPSLATATRRYLMERLCDVFMWQAAARQSVMSELAVLLYRCSTAASARTST
jgi:hypothetical protein